MVETHRIVEWLQRVVHIPSVGRRNAELRSVLVAEPTMCAPICGHKGASNAIFEIQGEAAHSSKPHLGKNAIVAAAPLITALAAEHERVSQLKPLTDVGAPTLAVVMISGRRALNTVPDNAGFTSTGGSCRAKTRLLNMLRGQWWRHWARQVSAKTSSPNRTILVSISSLIDPSAIPINASAPPCSVTGALS